MRHKFKFFDLETKKWFAQVNKAFEGNQSKDSTELVLTQNGELILIEIINGVTNIVHEKYFPTVLISGEEKPKYIRVQYTGIRDVNEKKYYLGDVVKIERPHDNPKLYELIWFFDRLGLRDAQGNEYETTRMQLHESENMGSIYEFPLLLK